MKRLILTAWVLLAGWALAFAQEEPQIQSRLSCDSILIGDQVRWSATLRLVPGEECYFEKPDEPVAEGLETIEGFAVDTVKQGRRHLDVECHMTLTAFEAGSYFLPPLLAQIQRTDGSVDTLFIDGPILEVATMPIDTATFRPFDIKKQIRYPLTFGEVAPWVLGVLIFAALVVMLVRFIRYRRENRDFFGRPKVVDPPHVVALRDLDRIRSKQLWQNHRQKQFYTEVTDTLRQYVASFYEVPAQEQTTAEIFNALKDKKIEPRLFAEVKELFERADFVKFAKHQATDTENEETVPTAVRFVNTTFLQRMEEEKAEQESEQKQQEDE